jgi:hypothetical protein
MSRFWKRFLREGQRFFGRGPKPQIWLGAFGKHPGWDDHIDDIGLETESLLLAKQILYVDGIGGQVNSGEWERLDGARRLAEFKHIFLWKRGDAFLAGRIWSSRDGKNRTQYPLVVCAHCLGIPFSWALTSVYPCLAEIERQCKATQSANEVRAVLGQALDQLRHSTASIRTAAATDLDFYEFFKRLGLSADLEGLWQIAYRVHAELENDFGGGQIRLPSVAGLEAETLSFWMRLLEFRLGRDAPILLTLPLAESWVDATCGEPLKKEFYCLRAKPETLAVATLEGGRIPDEFRKEHEGLIRELLKTGADSAAGPRKGAA